MKTITQKELDNKIMLKGWTKTIGATMAPKGYEFWSNGQSRFSGKREIILVKVGGEHE